MKKDLVLKLFEIGAVKFGSFTLASGLISPLYIDLRILVSHPKLLFEVASEMAELLKKLHFDRLAGVPYAALPIAVAISLQLGKPMVYNRKEEKEHGIQRPLEGEHNPGETIVIIEDLVTSAKSTLGTADKLIAQGLKVTDVVVFLDREQGGSVNLKQKGITLHSVVKLNEMLSMLLHEQKITQQQFDELSDYLQKNRAG